jgi:hypothetical protein
MFYPCAVRDHADRELAPRHDPGAAHATPDYQPELWLRAVTDFIDDVEAGAIVRGERVLGARQQRTGNSHRGLNRESCWFRFSSESRNRAEAPSLHD